MRRMIWLAVIACSASSVIAGAAQQHPAAVLAAGQGIYGQLGTGGTANSGTPVRLGFKAIDIAAGLDHSLAVLPDGSVKGWGINYQTQLGPQTGEQCAYLSQCKSTPRTIAGLSHVRQVAAGDATSVALRADGTVWSLGWNLFGQLGNGGTSQSSIPVKATGLLGVVSIAVGDNHTVALRADGTVWTWGWNSSGQLGRQTTTTCGAQLQPCGKKPRQVPGLGQVVAVAAGGQFSLALRVDGTVWGWGYNGSGQLGTTPGTCGYYPCVLTPHQIEGIDSVAAIAAGIYHVVALKLDGTVWTWGYNYYGQLGNGTTTGAPTPVPAKVAGLSSVRSVAAGQTFSFAIGLGGGLHAWGNNASGQFGKGTTISSSRPVAVSGSYLRAAGGGDHTLFIAVK